jgi:hypothetical protein
MEYCIGNAMSSAKSEQELIAPSELQVGDRMLCCCSACAHLACSCGAREYITVCTLLDLGLCGGFSCLASPAYPPHLNPTLRTPTLPGGSTTWRRTPSTI